MSYPVHGIRSRFGRQASTNALTGTAWTKFTRSTKTRSGFEIRNPDATLKLWVRGVSVGASAPTAPSGISTDADIEIAPGATEFIPWGEGEDVYLCNSSGLTTTSSYVMTEVAY